MITQHRLNGAVDAPSPNRSGKIDPKFIVMHYTASWEVGSVLRTFSSRSSKVSAHVTVDTDGTIYQHVPFNIKAWHAGPSSYGGYRGMNSHSIGIEIVNPGFCRVRNGRLYDAYDREFPGWDPHDFVASKHARVGGGTFYWPLYTKDQLDAVERLTQELISVYGIIDIVSHEEIDLRGWKTDPGPAFPMQRFKKLLNTRDTDSDTYAVTANSLNVRGGPGTNFAVIDRVIGGDRVAAVDILGDWIRINADGWVHSAYLRRV